MTCYLNYNTAAVKIFGRSLHDRKASCYVSEKMSVLVFIHYVRNFLKLENPTDLKFLTGANRAVLVTG